MAASLGNDNTSHGCKRGSVRRWVLLFLLAFAPCALAEDWTYRIRPGDTIWGLSGEYLKPGIPWQRLQAHNGIANPYQLPPGTTLRIPLAWLHRQPARAKVVAVRGEALVSGVDNPGPVVAGMQLGIGAVLQTTRDATLSLEFADGSRLLLQGDSELRLDRLSRYGKSGMVDTRLRLQRGRVTNDVIRTRGGAPAFIVDTPNASSAVRGTRFRVNASEGRTQAEVTEGTVAVSGAGRSALVKRGYGTVVAAGQSKPLRAIALLPAPDVSGIAGTFNGAQISLQWPVLAGARQYRVQASSASTFDTLVVDRVVADPRIDLPAMQEGRYSVRIRGIDAEGLEGRDGVAAFAAEAFPEAPIVISPRADSTVHAPQPEFRWARIPDAARYRFELSADREFAGAVIALQEKSTSLRAPEELAPGTYYWRIATEGSDGRVGAFSDPVAFSLQPLQEAGPVDSQPGNARDVTFRWRTGAPGQRYRFQLSRSRDFSSTRVDQVVGESQITLPKLPSGTWYLRAQAIGEDGFEGPLPPAQQIKVPCLLCRIAAGSGALLVLLAL